MDAASSRLGTSRSLAADYDVAMLDLDGVVYVGGSAVAGASSGIELARARGQRCAFITNNASRPPETVVDHLRELGVPAEPDEVVTSAQAAVRVLTGRVHTGDKVGLLGGDGLHTALTEAGLVPCGVDDPEIGALVSGYGPEVRWSEVMRAAVRIRDGVWWVAANTDYTIPTAYGVAPGHGVMVETLQRFSGVAPVVAGKPSPPLLEETIRRTAAASPLMVGDRLDTDIEGAHAVGCDSLLVLTGVTGLAELVMARGAHRPTYISVGLEGLTEPHGSPTPSREGWELGGWSSTGGRAPRVDGGGAPADWWRVVASHAWEVLDDTGEAVDLVHLTPPAAG